MKLHPAGMNASFKDNLTRNRNVRRFQSVFGKCINYHL